MFLVDNSRIVFFKMEEESFASYRHENSKVYFWRSITVHEFWLHVIFFSKKRNANRNYIIALTSFFCWEPFREWSNLFFEKSGSLLDA